MFNAVYNAEFLQSHIIRQQHDSDKKIDTLKIIKQQQRIVALFTIARKLPPPTCSTLFFIEFGLQKDSYLNKSMLAALPPACVKCVENLVRTQDETLLPDNNDDSFFRLLHGIMSRWQELHAEER
jgi:hypothetical protein